jgi:hypothetical protein
MTQIENTVQENGEQLQNESVTTSTPNEVKDNNNKTANNAIYSQPNNDLTNNEKELQRTRDEKGRFAKYPRLEKLENIVDDVLNDPKHKPKVFQVEDGKVVDTKEYEVKEEPKADDFVHNIKPDNFRTEKYKRVVSNAERPLSWSPALSPTWDNLKNFVLKGEGSLSRADAAAIMETIYRREEQVADGINAANGKSHRYKSMFSPYLDEIKSNNLDEEKFLKALADTHINLKYAPLSQKIQMYKELGKAYGIPMEGSTIGQSPLPQSYEQQLYESQRQLREINNQKYLQEEEKLDMLEQEWYKMQEDNANYPHFAAVSEKMLSLAETKQFESLDDLYNEAVQITYSSNNQQTLEKDAIIAKLNARLEALEAEVRQKQQSNAKKEDLNKLSIKTSQPSQSVTNDNTRLSNGKVNSRLELLRREFSKI